MSTGGSVLVMVSVGELLLPGADGVVVGAGAVVGVAGSAVVLVGTGAVLVVVVVVEVGEVVAESAGGPSTVGRGAGSASEGPLPAGASIAPTIMLEAAIVAAGTAIG